MKKTLTALAVLSATSGLALAAKPDVTMYGIVDAGVMTQNHTNAGGSNTAFTDAQIDPSIFGIKGGTDIGGGLKAGFTLEGGFSTGNGMHNSPGIYQSSVFGREAKVTIGGDWGTIGAGMQLDPALIASIGTEPRGLTDSFSNLENWILATAGNGDANSGSLQGGIFDTNALTYTYSANGLYLGAEYGFGGVSGHSSANSTSSVGASYSNSGFTVSGGYATANGKTAANYGKSSEIDFLGLGYATGPIALRAQFGEFKSGYVAGTAGADVQNAGIGMDYKTSGANLINLAYYNAKDKGATAGGKTTELALMDKYDLFKNTSVFAQLANVKADTNAGVSAAIGGVYTASGELFAPAGMTTTYAGLGMQYMF